MLVVNFSEKHAICYVNYRAE